MLTNRLIRIYVLGNFVFTTVGIFSLIDASYGTAHWESTLNAFATWSPVVKQFTDAVLLTFCIVMMLLNSAVMFASKGRV